MRSPATRVLAVTILALALTGCGAYGAATTATGSAPPAAFPVGTYEKQTDVERVTWTFRPDGIWTEVYELLDGSFSGPSKGRYVVSDSALIIDPLYPVSLEPSTHVWRVDGDLLWTTFSDGNDEDREFFASLDQVAWRRVP